MLAEREAPPRRDVERRDRLAVAFDRSGATDPDRAHAHVVLRGRASSLLGRRSTPARRSATAGRRPARRRPELRSSSSPRERHQSGRELGAADVDREDDVPLRTRSAAHRASHATGTLIGQRSAAIARAGNSASRPSGAPLDRCAARPSPGALDSEVDHAHGRDAPLLCHGSGALAGPIVAFATPTTDDRRRRPPATTTTTTTDHDAPPRRPPRPRRPDPPPRPPRRRDDHHHTAAARPPRPPHRATTLPGPTSHRSAHRRRPRPPRPRCPGPPPRPPRPRCRGPRPRPRPRLPPPPCPHDDHHASAAAPPPPAPPAAARPRWVFPIPKDIGHILLTIRTLESGGRYDVPPNNGRASGAYQFIASTWNNYARLPARIPGPDVRSRTSGRSPTSRRSCHLEGRRLDGAGDLVLPQGRPPARR